jgi:hypothetical protein
MSQALSKCFEIINVILDGTIETVTLPEYTTSFDIVPFDVDVYMGLSISDFGNLSGTYFVNSGAVNLGVLDKDLGSLKFEDRDFSEKTFYLSSLTSGSVSIFCQKQYK